MMISKNLVPTATALALGPLCLALAGAPQTAAAASIVTGYESPARDSFQFCNDDTGAWACEVVTLPAWAGFLRSDTRGQNFIAMDANQDGQSGFVAFSEQALQCEPDASATEGWTCAFLEGSADFRRIDHVTLYDYDQDGIEDVTYSHGDDGPHVCYGGTFPMLCEEIGINVGTNYEAIEWADFDGDGIDDAYLSYYRTWQTGFSQLCLGDGVGGFDCRNFTESSTSFSSFNSDAAVFDANGDPYPDLYVEAHPVFGSPGEICINDGDGTFSCTTASLTDIHYQGSFWGSGSSDVKVSDMDGDGLDDLVMGSRGDAYVCWGNGTNSPDCQYLDGVTTFSDLDISSEGQVSLSDADGDGLQDLVRSTTGTDEAVDLCTNNGDRTFSCTSITANGRYHGVAFLDAGPSGPPDADGDGVPDDEDVCPGADDTQWAPGLTDHNGFDVDIDIDGEDVVLNWSASSTSSGNYEVWRATNIDDLPAVSGPCSTAAGPTATLVSSGADLSSIDLLGAPRQIDTPTYYYRVLTDGDDPVSDVMAKVTHDAHPGYNLWGACLADTPTFASDWIDFYDEDVRGVHMWDSASQSFETYWATDVWGDFEVPFGGVVIVNFWPGVDPYRSMVGRVPTDETPLAAVAGHNVLSWPLATTGDEPAASAYLPNSGFTGIEDWDAATQTSSWYYGPNDADFTLGSCRGYGFAN
ncbi:MAG: hypothetical protein AAF799_29930 [Myxococcota bacterium]